MNFLLVFLGGGIGCVSRYLIGLGFQRMSFSLPWATFCSNVIACLIFAIVLWSLQARPQAAQSQLRLLLLTGFCGGMSTFSSFSYETFLLFRQGLSFYAILNILISSAICILIFYIFK